jgi:segregation and condensation protein B
MGYGVNSGKGEMEDLFLADEFRGRFPISFAGMKKPVKKGKMKAQDANLGNETAPYAPEYAHILAAELEVNPDFGQETSSELASSLEEILPTDEHILPNEPDSSSALEVGMDVQTVLEGVQDMAHQIEALLFASEKPLDTRQVAALLSSLLPEAVKVNQVQQVLDDLVHEWQQRPGGFELVQSGGGYCFLTRSAFLPIVQKAVLEQSKRKLSVASLETLSIVAYKQPVSKSEVEQIRGVNCDFSIQKLLEKNLIKISGKGDGPGRPTLYATTELFMDYFGINNIKQLPQLKELEQEGHEIGRDDDDDLPFSEMLHGNAVADESLDSEHNSSQDSEESELHVEEHSVQDDQQENVNTTDSRDAD